jgi:exopolyphosphatase / guanosine-5'-triphosphate,3'-diphosphate pyrophosphatase
MKRGFERPARREGSMEDTLASIEIGTNSIRMLIARIHGTGGEFRTILRKRSITRLGEGFSTHGPGGLSHKAMARSIEVLEGFLSLALQQGAFHPIVVTTGVVRRATNKDAFVDMITQNLNIPITIISGQREADLTWKGVTRCREGGGAADLIFDLGGGSTEFILSDAEQRKNLSLDIGAVTLTDEYLTSDPPADAEIHNLTDYIERVFKQCLDPWKAIIRGRPLIVGTGGTVITLAAIIHGIEAGEFADTINGLVIQAEAIQPLSEAMKAMPAADRLKLKGLEPGREDSIVAGTLVVAKVMEYFHHHEIVASYSDILEGILVDYIEGEVNG